VRREGGGPWRGAAARPSEWHECKYEGKELPPTRTRTPTPIHTHGVTALASRLQPLPASLDHQHASSMTSRCRQSIRPSSAHRTRLLYPSLPPRSATVCTQATPTPLPPAPPLTYRHVRGAQVLDRALEELVHKELAQVLHAGRGRGGGRRLLHLMMTMMVVGRRGL